MNQNMSLDNKGKMFSFLIFSILLGIFASVLSLKSNIAIFVGILYLFVWFFNVKLGILITLLFRSSLDAFNNYNIQFGSFKIASLIGVFFILITLLLIITKKVRLESKMSPYFLVFLVIVFTPTIIMGDYSNGFEVWLKLVGEAAMYFLVYFFAKNDRKFLVNIINCTVYSAIIPLIVGFYQFSTNTGNHVTKGLNRLFSTFIHPNPFAFYLVVIIVACIIKYSYFKGERRINIFNSIILLGSIMELYFTFTRAAWMGVFTIIILYLITLKGAKKYLLFMVLITGLAVLYPLFTERFNNVLSSDIHESSLAVRAYIWVGMFSLALKNWIFGYGLGTFSNYAKTVVGWDLPAHNEYLRMFFETGLIGLLSYFIFQIKTLIYSFDKNKLNYIVFSMVLGFAAMSAGSNILDNLVSQWYLWALVAVSHAIKSNKLNLDSASTINLFNVAENENASRFPDLGTGNC
jgi:O-antigen ligase